MSYKTRFTLILITVVLLIAAYAIHGERLNTPPAGVRQSQDGHDHAGHGHDHDHADHDHHHDHQH